MLAFTNNDRNTALARRVASCTQMSHFTLALLKFGNVVAHLDETG